MKHAWKSGTMPVFIAAALLSAALLGGCGSSSQETIGPATGNVLTAGTPTVGLSACATCHTRVTADWLTSKHANLDPAGTLYSAGVPTLGQIAPVGACAKKCHDPNGDSGNLSPGYTGYVQRPVIGCETCHGPGSLHANVGGPGPISLLSGTFDLTSIGSTSVSGQFALCTNCHELLDSSGTTTEAVSVATHLSPTGPTPTGSQYVITDTHFATAGDWTGGANVKAITGYAMDFAGERVCTTCHNPHKSADINKEWAQSRHADKTAAGAWAHYNWSTRPTCQRCHTATGFAAYADALGSSDLATAEAIRSGTLASSPVFSTATWSPEMLKCNGCHTDYRGTLRNPGAYTANYNYSTAGAAAMAAFSYPDASSSNVCIPCHSARMNGDSVKNLLFSNETVTSFSNLSFIDSHYLAAAGTMYAATGYTFPRSYTNPATYKHDLIGTSAAQNTGSTGPCVGCHMYRTGQSANHLFRAVGKDSSGAIISIVSEVCYQCHANSSSSVALMVDKERIEYEDALAALIDQMDKKGISFYPGYPYMFQQRTKAGTVSVTTGSPTVTGTGTSFTGSIATDYFRVEVDGATYSIASVTSNTLLTLSSNYTGPTTTSTAYVIMKGTRTDGVINWLFGGSQDDGRNNMGAAFNLQVLEHEPGAYIHNSKYVKRLIYDSIDWIDDGALNNSVGATLDALPAATTYKDGAMVYLLPLGKLWQGAYPDGYGVDSERP